MRIRLLAVGIALASTCAMVHRGSAQELRLEAEAIAAQNFPGHAHFQMSEKQQMQATTERQRTEYQRYLAVRVDQLKRVCQLSGEQVKTLQVAAKGAVRLSMGKWQKQVRQQQAQLHVAQLRGGQFFLDVVDVPFLADDGADAEEAGAEEGQEEVGDHDHADPDPLPPPEIVVRAQGAFLVSSQSGGVFSSVARERVWTKAVQRVLTGRQQKAYREAVAERNAFNRKAAVSQLVAKIDEHLLLSSSQRRKMVGIVDETMAGKMAERRGAGLPVREVQAGDFQGLGMTQIVQLFPKAKIQAVLSETQRARWGDFKGAAAVDPPMIFGRPGNVFQFPEPLRNNNPFEDAE